MGTDIHLYIEKKDIDDQWEEVKIDERLMPDERNYSLFYFLAGVRYSDFEVEPQFPGRGIPEDSSVIKSDRWIGDHSFTYAYFDELLAARWEKAGLERCYFLNFCKNIIPRLTGRFLSYLPEEDRNVRIIIGFDN